MLDWLYPSRELFNTMKSQTNKLIIFINKQDLYFKMLLLKLTDLPTKKTKEFCLILSKIVSNDEI